MQYKEFIPSSPLRPHIKCYWLLYDESGFQTDFEKIIPDGSPELIIHLGSPFDERIDGIIKRQDAAFLYGQLFSSIEIRSSRQPRVAGIKFHPYGLTAFTSILQSELAGKRNAIKELFPYLPFEEYIDKLHSSKNTDALFAVIDQMMLAMLRQRKNFAEEKVEKIRLAVSNMYSTNGMMKIDELTRSLNISRRELERKFNRYIGLSPKQLARIFRLQFALQKKSKAELLTHLALEAGYYDQAHFIREFAAIVKQKPSEYFRLESELTATFLSGS